jgi:hypothetical protein
MWTDGGSLEAAWKKRTINLGGTACQAYRGWIYLDVRSAQESPAPPAWRIPAPPAGFPDPAAPAPMRPSADSSIAPARLRSARRRAAAVLAALTACVLAAGRAQAQAGVAGRVLDRAEGTAIASAAVRITAEDTHATAATLTDSAGRFSLALPAGAGPFTLRAERVGYVALSVTVTSEAARAGLWRDLRLGSQAVRLQGVAATETRPQRRKPARRTPGGTEDNTVTWARDAAPIAPGDLVAAASLTPGVQASDDGLGLSIFAQDPSQTRTTLDGASFGATTLPQEALAGVTVVTSAYDVSRGQYSAGAVEATTLSGTNLFGGAVRTRFSDPQLQWRPVPSATRWPESTMAQAEGGVGGAIVPNRLFWYAAGGASRRSSPLVTLDNAAPAVLTGMGVAPDSAAALQSVLRARGIGPTGASAADAVKDASTGLLRLDYDFADHHSLMLRLDGRRGRLGGLGADPLSTLGSAGVARDDGAGALAQLSSRLGGADNRLRAYGTRAWQSLAPDWAGAAGQVRLPSTLEGASGSSVLRFGGARLQSRSASWLLEIGDELTAPLGRGHELRAGFAFSAEHATQAGAANGLGTFSFASLADLRAGRPSTFTRTLGEARGEAATRYGALWLGDVWKVGRVALTWGGRLEGRWYPGTADDAAAELFGLRPGRVPGEWGVSPRLGWTYDGGRWFLRGGVGEFRGSVPVQALAPLLGQAGSGGQVELACVGPAAPAPEWELYARDPGAVPSACAGGAPGFTSRSRPLTLFADDFAAPRTWHASLGGVRRLSNRVRVQLDASLTRGVSQPAAVDLNLAATPAFTLADEGNRPVYAPAGAIDPRGGGVAPGAARPYAEWGAVREVVAGGRSRVAQVSTVFDFYYPRLGGLLSAAYTWTRASDEVGGLFVPGASYPVAPDGPGLLRAAADRDRRHDLQLRLMLGPRPWVRIGLLGRAMSGVPFTPLVDGDVNGDGAANDRAFVFTGAARDTALAAGMARLLATLPAGMRDCLERQAGRLAERNGCRTGWSTSLDLRVELQPWRRALEHRLLLSVSTVNGLTLLDRALHGGDGLHGWGQPAGADPVLLRVRGFDPAARAWRYEVNPAFGARDAARVPFLRPFSLVVEARVTVGSDPTVQPLQSLLNETMGPGRTADELRFELARRVPNLPAQVVSIDSLAALRLTAEQRTALLERARSLGARLAPLTDSLADAVSRMERSGKSSGQTWKEVGGLTGRLQATLGDELKAIRALLTEDQWTRLPPAIRLPARQLVPPRRPGRDRDPAAP